MRVPDINSTINRVLEKVDQEKVGMVALHIGIVKGRSENGKKVKSLRVSFDKKKIKEIEERIRSEDSISEVNVALNEGELLPGDWIMSVMIVGEVRDKVFPALIKTVDMIKKEAAKKEEIYEDGNGEYK
jgi:molybdopterin synthase catalytic subunit